jgi:hypothetical protein
MKSRPASTHGFALVIALSLMAFILLLILSITTLVRVETQSANIQLAQLEARMNAQLGAMVALGDLQRYTGPDQRVTARSDILLAPDDPDIAGQSRWTGVWSSIDITSTSNLSPEEERALELAEADGLDDHKPRWMVSGNDLITVSLDPSAPLPALPATVETADLTTLGGSVPDKTEYEGDTVKAPKVEILGENNAPAGHYAYWVSDEGVKARVNMADPFLDSDTFNPNDPYSDEAYYRTAMAQVADPTAVSNSNGDQLLAGTSSRWKDGNEDLGKISSLKNIPIFTEDALPSDEFFHDFTVHSSGVLANVKDGGLKRDLSTALLSLPSDMSSGIGGNDPSGLIFPRANQASLPGEMDPGGPKWEQLANYYRMAGGLPALDIDGSEVVGSELPNNGPIKLRMPTNEQVGFTPVITRSNFFVQGFAERNKVREDSGNWVLDSDGSSATLPGTLEEDWEDPDGPSGSAQAGDWYYAKGYRYSLGMFPLITLWNPYDRDMIFDDLGLEFEMYPINIVDGKGSTTVVAYTGQHTSKGSTRSINRQTVKFVIRGTTIKAGEAVNFSPHCNSLYNDTDPLDNVLVAGASSYVHGFFTPAKESSSNSEFWEQQFWSGGKDNGKSIHDMKFKKNTDVVDANYDLGIRSRLSLNFAQPNHTIGKQLVMLYNSTDTTGRNFLSENRFKIIQIVGSGKFVNTGGGDARQPHVIPTTRLGGLDDFTGFYNLHINNSASNPNYLDPFSLPEGSSFSPGTSYFSDFVAEEGYSRNDEDDIEEKYTNTIDGSQLAELELSRRLPFGAFGVMKFPRVPNTDWYNGNNSANEVATHLFINMNPTAPVIHKETNYTWNSDNRSVDELRIYGEGPVAPWSWKERQRFFDEHAFEGADGEQAYVGLSNTFGEGSSKMVLFEVPDNIPLSIGQLAQANLMNHDVYKDGSLAPAIGNCIEGNGNGWNTHTLQTYATPTYAIGNSLANPLLPLDETEKWWAQDRVPWVSKPAAHYDYSYKLNDTLWDEYFFSGITDTTDLNDPFPLPNSRLSPSSPFISSSDLTAENRAAANLLQDGAFNINSTSVAAWEAVLGAMRDIETQGHSLDTKLRHNFARFNAPIFGTPADDVPNLSSRDRIAAGFRNLTDAQIASLASEIVDEIRLRRHSLKGEGYPFLSLSGFINRLPTSNNQEFALRGALQAAIDKAGLNGLELSSTGLWAESEKYPLYYNSSGTPVVDRPKADGMAGSLMQSDLLAKIGAFIQARSDTFTIRSFGSSQEQFASNQESRAYYEMVVQRTPAYVDPADNDYDDPTPLSANEKFGRKYEIKSQRWVSSDEI